MGARPRPGIADWRRYLRFWGEDVDADVSDELRFHLDMRQRDYEARGLAPDEAQRVARARFGDLAGVERALLQHDHRRARGRRWREFMDTLWQDVRFGWRSLRRAPGFALVAVLTLALGIGATTAIFSVVNAVVLRPLPYADADRVVMVWMDNRPQAMAEDIHSWPNYADLRDQRSIFSSLAAYSPAGLNVTGGCLEGQCEPQRIRAAYATPELFTVMGVPPVLGRPFTAEEDVEGRDAVVVVSHGLWTRLLGSRPDAIGRTLRLNGRERTVIGVMPRDFAFPTADTDVWVPLALPPDARTARGSYGLYVIGRLAGGTTLERARTDALATWRRIAEANPGSLDQFGLNIVPLPEQLVGRTLRTALWIMLAAVAAVLLIGCANVANLMLSRAAAREREVSVRLAIGAGPQRLVRQLLTESLLLSVVGGAAGLALAWGALRVLVRLAPTDIPRLGDVRLDGPVLGVSMVVVVLTGLVFGLAPALQASRKDLALSLREGGRGGTAGRRGNQVRQALAAAQVALVVVLLTGAGLLLRSFQRVQQVPLGFRESGLLTTRIALPGARYQQGAQRVAFFDQLLERLRAQPGVQGVAATTSIFLSQTPNSTTFSIEGRDFTQDERSIEVPLDAVTDDYFKVMGVPLLQGRTFTPQDAATAPPVVVINANMARRFWPGESPLGRRMRYGGPQSQAPWMTIVGVVADMRRTGLESPVRFETFLPHAQAGNGGMTLVVRTAGDPLAMVGPVRAAVRALDAEQPVYDVKTMDQLLGERVAQRRFSMTLLATFAGLALVLGLVGVYGVTAYLVAQRTREVGLRIALGARPRQLVAMVVGQGMRVAGVGLVLGLLVAMAGTRVMSGMLYEVSPLDVTTLAAVVGLLVLATLVANWLPARRAARVEPLTALREE